MPIAYLILKFFHILLAITAVGANISYGAWFARANAHPESAPFALRGIAFVDNWIANPAYVLLLPTGAAMVIVGGYSFGTHWISWALGLWVVLVLAGVFGYTPTLRAQIAAVDREGVRGAGARTLAIRGQIWGAVLGLVVLAILLLMVFKPA